MPSQSVTNVANAIVNKINNLISSHNSNGNAHQDIRESIPSATSELDGDYLQDNNGSRIFNTFNGGYNYANETITYTSSDNKVSYTHDYNMWEDSSGELANLNDLNKRYYKNFTGNETIINKSFDYNWGVKFTYTKTNTTNIDGYIQLGEDIDTCILVGIIEDESTSSIKLFDNLTADEQEVIVLPNNLDSFDIRIWQVWNEDDLRNNVGEEGDEYHCTTYVYTDIDGDTREYSSSLAWYPSFNTKILQRDIIHKIIQDTNSRITNLTFSTDGIYIEKSQTNGLLKNDGTVDTTSYSTFDGNYNNLTNKPSIPLNTSELNNDNGFITSNHIINNDNFCDYKTLIPLVDEGENISNVSFEDYDFDIMFKINPNIENNDCQGSIDIGDPAVGGVFVQYSNQEIQIQTQSGDKFNTALNMTSENTVKIKQDKLTNDLTITVNNHEFISTDNSEITKNITEIITSAGTISNFGVKTCTRIITEATINAPTNKNLITTSFTPSKLISYIDLIENDGIVNNHNSFTVTEIDYLDFDFGCQNNEYYEFDITTSRGHLNIYGPKRRKKYCELYRDTTYTIKITHDELLIVKGTTVDGTTVVDLSNSNGILLFDAAAVCQVDFSNKKWYHEATFFDKIYPIGSVHITTNSVNPSNYFDGEWERIQDTFLLASGTTYENGATGGSATVTLTASQSGVPQHTHTYAHTDTTYKANTTSRKPGTSTAANYVTSITGTANNTTKTSNNNNAQNAAEAHNNMPPYLAVYMWERVG